MTTTITPASGAAPLYTQQGTGTTPGYSALDDRRAAAGPLQAGVYGTSTLVTAGGVSNVANADFMVTQRGAGANMSVDINMPAGGFAWVAGTTINGQGLYCVPVHSANINESIAAADPTYPRVDQVILEVQDNVLDASGGNLARTRVLTGTPTSGATLSNRSGAAVLPGSCLLLGDVLVGAGATSVSNSQIRDRRKWARGAFASVVGVTTGPSTTSSSFTVLTDMQARLEFSGAPVELLFSADFNGTVAGDYIAVKPQIDGVDLASPNPYRSVVVGSNTSNSVSLAASWAFSPSAGSHLVQIVWSTSGGTATSFDTRRQIVVAEAVRQSALNNVVTTG